MFYHLNDLSYPRSLVEAIGLYIVMIVASTFIVFILGGIMGKATPGNDFGAADAVGQVIFPLVTFFFSFRILTKKRQLTHPLLLAVAIAGIVVPSILNLGGFAGLLAPAVLSTVDPREPAERKA